MTPLDSFIAKIVGSITDHPDQWERPDGTVFGFKNQKLGICITHIYPSQPYHINLLMHGDKLEIGYDNQVILHKVIFSLDEKVREEERNAVLARSSERAALWLTEMKEVLNLPTEP
jgi:hypothetical protein